METIRKYVEGLFAGYPHTDKLQELKNSFLSQMYSMFEDLRRQGKTEKEAIGLVIAEYIDIEEQIRSVQNKSIETPPEPLPVVYKQEGEEYLSKKRSTAWMIGAGVVLCILGVTALIALNTIGEDETGIFGSTDRGVLGLVVLLVFIAVAVGMFVYSGVRMEKYEGMKGGFTLEKGFETEVLEQKEHFEKTYVFTLILGIVLCILSPLAFIIPFSFQQEHYGYELLIFFTTIAIAVFLLIFFGTIRDGYRYLLRVGEYSSDKRESDRATGVFSAIIWPVATCIFLLAGLLWNKWHIAWIVYVIAGILNGMVNSVYKSLRGGRKNA